MKANNKIICAKWFYVKLLSLMLILFGLFQTTYSQTKIVGYAGISFHDTDKRISRYDLKDEVIYDIYNQKILREMVGREEIQLNGLIDSVFLGSPAYFAGFKKGDFIRFIEGSDYYRLSQQFPVRVGLAPNIKWREGDTLHFYVLRDNTLYIAKLVPASKVIPPKEKCFTKIIKERENELLKKKREFVSNHYIAQRMLKIYDYKFGEQLDETKNTDTWYYDKKGNLLGDLERPDHFAYDDNNRVIRSGLKEFDYDLEGNIVEQRKYNGFFDDSDRKLNERLKFKYNECNQLVSTATYSNDGKVKKNEDYLYEYVDPKYLGYVGYFVSIFYNTVKNRESIVHTAEYTNGKDLFGERILEQKDKKILNEGYYYPNGDVYVGISQDYYYDDDPEDHPSTFSTMYPLHIDERLIQKSDKSERYYFYNSDKHLLGKLTLKYGRENSDSYPYDLFYYFYLYDTLEQIKECKVFKNTPLSKINIRDIDTLALIKALASVPALFRFEYTYDENNLLNHVIKYNDINEPTQIKKYSYVFYSEETTLPKSLIKDKEQLYCGIWECVEEKFNGIEVNNRAEILSIYNNGAFDIGAKAKNQNKKYTGKWTLIFSQGKNLIALIHDDSERLNRYYSYNNGKLNLEYLQEGSNGTMESAAKNKISSIFIKK